MNSNQDNAPDTGEKRGAVSKTAGALLREAREAQGLHVAALAVAMKVPVKKLEALEADRLDQTSDAVFVRALASGVCRALKIDASPILERLPASPIPRLSREERVVNAAFTVPTASQSWSMPEILTKPAAIGVFVLIVGAGVLLLLPDSISLLDREERAQTSAVNETSPAATSPAGVNGVSVPAFQAADTPAVAVNALPPAAEASQAAASSQVASAPAGPDVPGATNGVVAFHVRGSSWVEVTDAKGVVQLRKTLQAGEKAAASGALPLSVIVGRADVTEVEVRGQAFAIGSVAKDNVARFEVK